MKIKVVKLIEKEIERCFHECPYFELDGNAMVCGHPYWNDKGAYAGCIITHPECDNGFPEKCPLMLKAPTPDKLKRRKMMILLVVVG